MVQKCPRVSTAEKIQDELDELIPEKLNIIKTIISIKEPQRKLNNSGLGNWIRGNWNLHKADLQTLRNNKDCLRGEKVPLKKLMQIHNETTAVKATPEQNEHEALPSTKSKAKKMQNGTNDDGNHNSLLSPTRVLAGHFISQHPTNHLSQTHTQILRQLQR